MLQSSIKFKKVRLDMLACQTVLFELNIARKRAFLTFLYLFICSNNFSRQRKCRTAKIFWQLSKSHSKPPSRAILLSLFPKVHCLVLNGKTLDVPALADLFLKGPVGGMRGGGGKEWKINNTCLLI